jgi:hypothetical protein
MEELDEEATVDTTAEQGGRLHIVFRRRLERWYEAALVVEDSPSMDIWHEHCYPSRSRHQLSRCLIALCRLPVHLYARKHD